MFVRHFENICLLWEVILQRGGFVNLILDEPELNAFDDRSSSTVGNFVSNELDSNNRNTGPGTDIGIK